MSNSLKSNPLAQLCFLILFLTLIPAARAGAQSTPAAAALDVLVLSNGDTLHGTLVKELGGTVTFHTDALGDVNVPWDKIKELHAAGSYGVLEKGVKLHGRRNQGQLPMGTVEVESQAVTVHPGERRGAAAHPGQGRGVHHRPEDAGQADAPRAGILYGLERRRRRRARRWSPPRRTSTPFPER